jgi:hypothetical protein
MGQQRCTDGVAGVAVFGAEVAVGVGVGVVGAVAVGVAVGVAGAIVVAVTIESELVAELKPVNRRRQMEVGKNYLVESVTSSLYVGCLVSVDGPHTVTLADAAWVCETGRLHTFMRQGRASGMEVEPVGTICVHWATWRPWPHALFPEAV